MSNPFEISWTVEPHQALLSMESSRQEYWSRLPFPPLGDLPDPRIESTSPAWQADSLPLSHQGSPIPRSQYRKTCTLSSLCFFSKENNIPREALYSKCFINHFSWLKDQLALGHPISFLGFDQIVKGIRKLIEAEINTWTYYIMSLHHNSAVYAHLLVGAVVS